MTSNAFGRNIPQSAMEEIELHNLGGIEYITMLDKKEQLQEVPTYNVVNMCGQGWNIQTREQELQRVREIPENTLDTDIIQF